MTLPPLTCSHGTVTLAGVRSTLGATATAAAATTAATAAAAAAGATAAALTVTPGTIHQQFAGQTYLYVDHRVTAGIVGRTGDCDVTRDTHWGVQIDSLTVYDCTAQCHQEHDL